MRELRLFDIYAGPGVGEGKKSLAFSLRMRAGDRTLTARHAVVVATGSRPAIPAELAQVIRAYLADPTLSDPAALPPAAEVLAHAEY